VVYSVNAEHIRCILQYEYGYAVTRKKVPVVFDGEDLVSINEDFAETNKSKCLPFLRTLEPKSTDTS
jgi:hypothetical protein